MDLPVPDRLELYYQETYFCVKEMITRYWYGALIANRFKKTQPLH